MLIAASPLMFTVLAGDCSHQKRTSHDQSNEAKINMEGAQAGTWGGEHIGLEVNAQGGQVEYDCAHGTIEQKIVTDAQGNFKLRGTHVREHGGPVRKDETEDAHPARYEGQIKGDMMTLTVTESDTNQLVGTFTLVFGRQPHIMKCR
jgi:hypothetical protein